MSKPNLQATTPKESLSDRRDNLEALSYQIKAVSDLITSYIIQEIAKGDTRHRANETAYFIALTLENLSGDIKELFNIAFKLYHDKRTKGGEI